MAAVINPEIRVKVETIFGDTWDSSQESTRLDIEVDITKDLTGEPNQAMVRIYNLNDDTLALFNSMPNIEIAYNQYGDDSLTTCYVGEIVEAYTEDERPGTVTTLVCESQSVHCRNKYVSLQYEAGTAIGKIIDDLISEIGLPTEKATIPTLSVVSARSLTGSAFQNLQLILNVECGMYCFVSDGILYVSSMNESPISTVVEIKNSFLTRKPSMSTRKDVIGLTYVVASNNTGPSGGSFSIAGGRVKKTTKQKWLDENSRLVEVAAIDDEIQSVSLEILGLPDLQPDSVIEVEGETNRYRIQRLSHRGDNHQGVITHIDADIGG